MEPETEAQMAITREQVFERASEIAGEGKEPTYIDVRARIGSGSFSTISKHLREWKAGNRETPRKDEPEDLPGEFTDALTRFGAEVWRAAGARARQQVEAARQAFEERAREFDSELERASNTVDTLQEGLEGMTADRDELSRELVGVRARLSESEGVVTELRRVAEEEALERESLIAQVQELNGRLSKEEALREGAAQKIGELEERLTELSTEGEVFRKKLDELAAERTALKEEIASGKASSVELKRALLQVETQLGKEEKRNAELTSRVTEISDKLTEMAEMRGRAEERLSLLSEKKK